MELNYFGTNLTTAGHYFWILNKYGFNRSKVYFSNIPFDPEQLPRPHIGNIDVHQFGEYAICAVKGSPYDKRGGCKSVFWLIGNLAQLEEAMLSTPVVKEIIEGIPENTALVYREFPNK